MTIKHYLTLAICLLSCPLFAQTSPSAAKQAQFLLIIRSKANFQPPADAIQTNIKHWQEFMGSIGKEGKIAGGYRPGSTGTTVTGTNKTVGLKAYTANDEVVSSVLIINAADMNEAQMIAAKCPVLELQGSVEVRPIQMAN